MKQFIHKLRQQREGARKNILHILTIMFAVIFVLLWIYTLTINFSDKDNQINMKNDLQSIKDLKSNLIDSYTQSEDGTIQLEQ